MRAFEGTFAVLLLSLSALASAAPQGPAEITLDGLMSSLAQRKQGDVSFVETDYLAILDRPVRSAGVLVYRAPDHLEKRTLKPRKESLVLDGDQMTMQRGHRTYRAELSAYPQVAPFVDAVRETLAGNEEGLQRLFKVGLTGTMADWKLELTPLDARVARAVQQVQITGQQAVIRSVEILQVDGDRSVMTLGRPIDAAGSSGNPASRQER